MKIRIKNPSSNKKFSHSYQFSEIEKKNILEMVWLDKVYTIFCKKCKFVGTDRVTKEFELFEFLTQ